MDDGKKPMNLVEPIVDLYRRMSYELPADVERALVAAREVEEEGSSARSALDVILEDVGLARENQRPLCQDTGLPVFYVSRPVSVREREVVEAIRAATREATRRNILRPNAVEALTGRNSGDNVGADFPIIHVHEVDDDALTIDAMLKGGGCENAGVRYKLPDASLGASRDLDGVRRCVLDAIVQAQGRACPPYVLGIAIGGARDATAELAKRLLMRQLDAASSPPPSREGSPRTQVRGRERGHDDDVAVIEILADLERRLLSEINELGIGPAGLGGRTTVLGVKIASQHRHCACYFVEVAFGCWAMRRGSVRISKDGVSHA